MAIDEDRVTEPLSRALDEPGQGGMKRHVEPVDALERCRERQPGTVDLLPVGNDAGDRAEPADDPDRLRIGEVGERLGEQLGVELIGLAIDVEVGAREARRNQRGAERGDAGEPGRRGPRRTGPLCRPR